MLWNSSVLRFVVGLILGNFGGFFRCLMKCSDGVLWVVFSRRKLGLMVGLLI